MVSLLLIGDSAHEKNKVPHFAISYLINAWKYNEIEQNKAELFILSSFRPIFYSHLNK